MTASASRQKRPATNSVLGQSILLNKDSAPATVRRKSLRAGLVLPAAQFRFQDLAIVVLGKRLDEDIFFGPLETRDMVEANLVELGFVDPGPVARDHVGDHLFSPIRMLAADDGHLQHLRVQQKNLLDLPRIDVAATGNNQVLGAVLQRQKAVIGHRAEIAGEEPAIPKRLRRCSRIVPVAAHADVAVRDDLADLARRQVMAVLIDDADLDAGPGDSDGCQPLLVARMLLFHVHALGKIG